MTAQQPEREHCKIEGRCIDFTFAPKEWRGKNDQCLLCGCDGDTRSRPHTPAPEQHFECDSCGEYIFEYPCQYCGWIERGINIKEHDATTARTATLAAKEDTLLEVIPLLDTRTSAYTKVNLMLAKCRLDKRTTTAAQEDK